MSCATDKGVIARAEDGPGTLWTMEFFKSDEAFQRTDKRGVEQDPEVVRRRQQETWPEIGAEAKKDGGETLFADRADIRSDVSEISWPSRRLFSGARGAWVPGCRVGGR